MSGITIKGYEGTWHVIDSREGKSGRKLFLLEHDKYGDETEGLIVDNYLRVVLDDVWNGWNDLEDADYE